MQQKFICLLENSNLLTSEHLAIKSSFHEIICISMNLLRNHWQLIVECRTNLQIFIEHENALNKSLNALKTSGHCI